MNSTFNLNLGALGATPGVLAAAAIFAYGVWVGQRDLGLRAMWSVAAALVVAGAVPVLLYRTNVMNVVVGGVASPLWTAVGSVAIVAMSVLLSLLPLALAVSWLGVIRRAARLQGN